MKVAQTIEAYRELRKTLKGTVAFVPTLGAMHKGHEALLQRAQELADHVVVSIFLNPIQFGPNEDLDQYPSNLPGDLDLCQRNNVAIVFTPQRTTLYPDGTPLTFVDVGELSRTACGASRPGHFRGVTTVVTKLFHIMAPHLALFGEKDFQQLAIIKQMVRDLNFDLEIVAVPTVREEDGLAVSSRNLRLTPDERTKAPILYQSLLQAERAIHEGERSGGRLCEIVRHGIEAVEGCRVDYVVCLDPEMLREVEGIASDVIVAVAAWVGEGDVRLIDNVVVSPAG